MKTTTIALIGSLVGMTSCASSTQPQASNEKHTSEPSPVFISTIVTETDLSKHSAGSTTQTTVSLGTDALKLDQYDAIYNQLRVFEIRDEHDRTLLLDQTDSKNRLAPQSVVIDLVSNRRPAPRGVFTANKVSGGKPPAELVIVGELRIASPEARIEKFYTFNEMGKGVSVSDNFHIAYERDERNNLQTLTFDYDASSFDLRFLPISIALTDENGRELTRPGATVNFQGKTVMRWEWRTAIEARSPHQREAAYGIRMVCASRVNWERIPFTIKYSEDASMHRMPTETTLHDPDAATEEMR